MRPLLSELTSTTRCTIALSPHGVVHLAPADDATDAVDGVIAARIARAVEQHLVAIVQARHTDVLLERRVLGADLTDGRGRLLRERRDAVGDHPAHAQLVSLRAVERRRLVGRRVVEQPDARLPGFNDLGARELVV